MGGCRAHADLAGRESGAAPQVAVPRSLSVTGQAHGVGTDSKVGTIESRRRVSEARGCCLRAIFRPGEDKGRRRDGQMVQH